MTWLARHARQILLLDATLLFGGVMLTSFNMLLIGWSVFAAAQRARDRRFPDARPRVP